jgi:hypothetical protein
MTIDLRPRDLYSRQYSGQESPELPEEFRRRLFHAIYDKFRLFPQERKPEHQIWAAAATMAGIEYKREAGFRYLVEALIRLVGLAALSQTQLAARWLEQHLLSASDAQCLDVVDILLAEWWSAPEDQKTVIELFEDFELPYSVRGRRVNQTEPPLARRLAKRRLRSRPGLQGFAPKVQEELDEAERVLQIGEDQNDWSRVGHHCRMALQDFAEAAYGKWYSKALAEPLEMEKTINKLRAVLGQIKQQVSETNWIFVDGLLESTNGLIQKTEHRSTKDAPPLSDSDTELCYTSTALLLGEALALFASTHAS